MESTIGFEAEKMFKVFFNVCCLVTNYSNPEPSTPAYDGTSEKNRDSDYIFGANTVFCLKSPLLEVV